MCAKISFWLWLRKGSRHCGCARESSRSFGHQAALRLNSNAESSESKGTPLDEPDFDFASSLGSRGRANSTIDAGMETFLDNSRSDTTSIAETHITTNICILLTGDTALTVRSCVREDCTNPMM